MPVLIRRDTARLQACKSLYCIPESQWGGVGREAGLGLNEVTNREGQID